jgi:hypothetical protein
MSDTDARALLEALMRTEPWYRGPGRICLQCAREVPEFYAGSLCKDCTQSDGDGSQNDEGGAS